MAVVHLIVAPYHAGAFNDRVGAGPTRLLANGLEDRLEAAGFDTIVQTVPSVDAFEGEIGRTFEIKRRIAALVADARAAGAFPVVLAGNCNSSVGVWAGLGAPRAGIVWFDAHPDFDTPDEHRSGYLDGMGVATLMGQCWRNLCGTIEGFRPLDPSHLVYCGIRDFEPGQQEKVRAHGIRAAAGSLSAETDYVSALASLLEELPFDEAAIHLDLDCLDTSVGLANEYAAPGGLTASQLSECLTTTRRAVRPISLTVASFNPNLDGAENICAAGLDAVVQVCEAAHQRR
jgi:arginase